MSSQTIGTGAVLLTANADGLLAGLNKAQVATERWAGKTAKKVSKAAESAGGGKGGLFGSILSGGAVGGAAGAAAGAALKGFDLVTQIPQMLKSLREASGQGEGGPLDRIISSIEKLQEIGVQLLATVISPLAPGFELIASYAGKFFERLQPIMAVLGGRMGGAFMSLVDVAGSFLDVALKGFEAVWPMVNFFAESLEAALFVAGEFATATLELVGQLVDWFGGLVKSVVDWGTAGMSGSQLFFKGLKLVAQTAGVVWDEFKYGAAIVAEVAAKIIDSLREIATVSDQLVGTNFAQRLEGAGQYLREFAREVNAGLQNSTADQLGKYIDGLQGRFDARAAEIADAAHVKEPGDPKKVELVGAHQAGSTEAYSILAKFQAGNAMAGTGGTDNPIGIAKKQLEQQKKTNDKLSKFVGVYGGGTVIRFGIIEK